MQQVNCATGLVRTDWYHPWNPGDVLHFGADTNPWHSNQHVALRLGEFLLYNEYDPRRAILFQQDGSVWSCQAFSNSGHACTDTGGVPGQQPWRLLGTRCGERFAQIRSFGSPCHR